MHFGVFLHICIYIYVETGIQGLSLAAKVYASKI